MSEDDVIVRIKDLHKSYGDLEVLRGIDIDVHRGEVVVVLGPSGSGKSTMLRCVNLLEKPTSGQIILRALTSRPRAWISTVCVPSWAWCSSSSPCSRIFRSRRTS